jgi:hypothetical protein
MLGNCFNPIRGRIFSHLVALCAMLFCQVVSASTEFPYTSYIAGEQVHSYSGPSATGEYRTDRLDRGQRVTIYKQESGWCAIRPPHGSYSWVEGRFVEQVKNGVGRVKQDRAPSYIGTHVQSKHDRVQVELRAGEMLEIMESVETASGLWYKISPPSGEFRWVASSDLTRDPPGQWPDRGTTRPAEGTSNPATSAAPKPLTIEPINLDTAKSATPGIDDWQAANVNRLREDLARNQVSTTPVPIGGQPLVSTPQNPTAPIGTTTTTTPPERMFQTEYEMLEGDISAMLVEDPAAWSLGSLNKRTDEMLSRATSALDRGKVRMLQAKLSRLEELKQRSLDANALAQSKGKTVPGIGAGTPNVQTNNPASNTLNPIAKIIQSDIEQGRFDGIGTLMPVIAKRPNAPKYALVDSNNNIVSLITPSPGVNLEAYVKQPVGVKGERGYIPELRKSHITVTNVTPADPASLARRASEGNIAR